MQRQAAIRIADELHQRRSSPNAMISIPHGWIGLVTALHEELVKIYPDYKIDTVSEKFGSLRFYTDKDMDHTVANLLKWAAFESVHICSRCSASGEAVTNSFYRQTLCVECAKQYSDK